MVFVPGGRVRRALAYELEAVVVPAPIYLRDKSQPTVCLGFYGGEHSSCVVVLIWICGRIECVCPVFFGIVSCLYVYRGDTLHFQSGLQQSVEYVIIAIGDIAARSVVTYRQTTDGGACLISASYFGSEQAVHTDLYLTRKVRGGVFFGYDIDTSRQSTCSVSERGGSLYYLDTFYIGQIYRDVETVMSCLWIGKVYTV